MQLSKKSRLTFVSGFTIVMMSLATCDAAAITLKEVSEVVEQMKISRYCGDKLNVAMKLFCHPRMREFILKSAAGKEVPNTCEYCDEPLWVQLSLTLMINFQMVFKEI